MSGIMYESVAWIYKVFITLIVAATVIWIVGSTITSDVNTREIQKQAFIARILYSPDSIWFTDNEGTHPGVLDINNFKQERMDNAFIYPDKYGGAKLTLVQGTTRSSIYIEQVNYEFYKNQDDNKIRGGGRTETHTYPVVVRKEDGTRSNAHLIIEVAYPEKA